MFDFQLPMIVTTLYVAPRDRVHMDALSEILRYTLQADGLPDPRIHTNDASGLCLHTGDLELRAKWMTTETEAQLVISLGNADVLEEADTPELQAHLLRLLRPLMAALRFTSVDWMQSGLRIPAQDFIDALCADDTTPPDGIAPRRVTRRESTRTARPGSTLVWGGLPDGPAQHDVRPRRIRPKTKATRRQAPVRKGPARKQDAHILQFERHLAHTLRRPASPEEINEMRLAAGLPGTPERIATWALSLCAATVSLPMALPVIAHNLAHGENLRAASLVMGLVGVFSLTVDPDTAVSLVSLF